MMFSKKYGNLIAVLAAFFFATLIILRPDLCRKGALLGILICGKIIIPNLFPFTMCVLFIMKSGITEKLTPLAPVTRTVFGLNSTEFTVLILSLIGGFPIGAKLISEALKEKRITPDSAEIMLNYCICGGPAFIIGAVGSTALNSQKIGFVLFFAHTASSLLLCIGNRVFKKRSSETPQISTASISTADNFVISAAEAASNVINICAFVILFCTINTYLELASCRFLALKILLNLTEITYSVTHNNNVFLLSFLLGFGGFCVWCQVISAAKGVKIQAVTFVLHRLFHGFLSLFITAYYEHNFYDFHKPQKI